MKKNSETSLCSPLNELGTSWDSSISRKVSEPVLIAFNHYGLPKKTTQVFPLFKK